MSNARDNIKAQMADEAGYISRTRIDLDAFLAAGNDRGAQWRGWDVSAKEDAVRQQLGRLGYGADAADVAFWIAKYDERYENGQRDSDLAIPPAAAILARASDEHATAQQHGDTQGVAQLNRVRMNITRGARLCWVRGDLLIASINNPGQVYSVNRLGCSCPNGVAGKAGCWHVALFDLLLAMLDTQAETADMEAESREDDDGDDGGPTGNPIAHAHEAAAWLHGRQQLATRLAATSAYVAALRVSQGRTARSSTPPIDIPDEPAPATEGDEPPVWPEENGRRLGLRLVAARRRSAYFASAFYLEAA